MSGWQDEAVVVRTLAFVVVRQVLSLIGLGPSPDAKDVEIAVPTSCWSCVGRWPVPATSRPTG
jgi:hypothetical protein